MADAQGVGKIIQPTNSHIISVKTTSLAGKTSEAEKQGAFKRNTFLLHKEKLAKVLESQLDPAGRIRLFITYPDLNRRYDEWVFQDDVEETQPRPSIQDEVHPRGSNQTEHFENNEHENMTDEEIRRHLESTRVKIIENIELPCGY